MPILQIRDKTGNRWVCQPEEMVGEIWMDDCYCGQFILYEDEMVLINRSMKIDVYIGACEHVGPSRRNHD
jgi:hypothetical protein